MTLRLRAPASSRPLTPSRRQFLLGALAAGTLAACGSGDDDGDGRSSGASGGGSPGGGFPRTIRTALGEVEVPARPRKVVALGHEADIAAALGIVPVVVPGSSSNPSVPEPWLADALGGEDVEVVDVNTGSLPLERIVAARPDVILAGTYYGIEDAYEDLSAIAPTVTYETGYYEDPWQDQVDLVARALGREARGREVVDAVEQAIADLGAAHPEWQGKTFAFANHNDAATIQVISNPDDPSARLFIELGLELAPGSRALPAQPGSVHAAIGLEHVDALDADVLLMLYLGDDLQRSLEANSLFRRIPAVADGRCEVVSLELATALRSPTPLSIRYALDHVETHLSNALPPA